MQDTLSKNEYYTYQNAYDFINNVKYYILLLLYDFEFETVEIK